MVYNPRLGAWVSVCCKEGDYMSEKIRSKEESLAKNYELIDWLLAIDASLT